MSNKNSKGSVLDVVDIPKKIALKKIPIKKTSIPTQIMAEVFKEVCENMKELNEIEIKESTKRYIIEKNYKMVSEKINFLFHSFDKLSEDKLNPLKKITDEGIRLLHKGLEENNMELINYSSVLLMKVLESLGKPLIGEEIEKITKNLQAKNLQDIEVDL